VGIVLLDQVDLPLALVLLEPLLMVNGGAHIGVLVEPDQPCQSIGFGKAAPKPEAMLADARRNWLVTPM
jgi:hypothetical protein